MEDKKIVDPYGEENWNDKPKKKDHDWFGKIMLGCVFTLLAFLVTTCAFHNKLKYDNIKTIEVKMVVVNEVYRIDREGKQDVTNFYLRVESPFMKTPEPDYLLLAKDYPTAREKDTLVCLVKYSNTLKKEWYSKFANIASPEGERFNTTLFYIKDVVKVIKPKK